MPRRHDPSPPAPLVESSADFSPCELYRYTLRRIWDREQPLVMFIGLNPSTADEFQNDPTIRRCIGFARDWGYGGLLMANIFAFRSTDPNRLTTLKDPVGADNDRWIRTLQRQASLVIAAWGVWGELNHRQDRVMSILTNPHCLGRTKDGHPRHPLYLKRSAAPEPYAYPQTDTCSPRVRARSPAVGVDR